MGIIPLEYLPGETADSLGLTGRERYTVVIPEQLTPRMTVDIKVHFCVYLILAASFYCIRVSVVNDFFKQDVFNKSLAYLNFAMLLSFRHSVCYIVQH